MSPIRVSHWLKMVTPILTTAHTWASNIGATRKGLGPRPSQIRVLGPTVFIPWWLQTLQTMAWQVTSGVSNLSMKILPKKWSNLASTILVLPPGKYGHNVTHTTPTDLSGAGQITNNDTNPWCGWTGWSLGSDNDRRSLDFGHNMTMNDTNNNRHQLPAYS